MSVWTAEALALPCPTLACVACGRELPAGLAPRADGTAAWLKHGVLLERVVSNDPDTAAAVRELMAAAVRRRLLDQQLAAAALLRLAAAWAGEATLLDVAHWALGPALWRAP